MRKGFRIALGVLGALVAFSSLAVVSGENRSTIRTIPIPPEEHGYSNFDTMVITTRKGLETFLLETSSRRNMAWNNRAAFEKGLRDAGLDFPNEALVLLRHTESFGGAEVTLRRPRAEKRKVICEVETRKPTVGTTAVMAYYCFALAVLKSEFSGVEFRDRNGQAKLIPIPSE